MAVFKFVIRYLGFLKSVPLLPQLFESMMMVHTLLTKPEKLDCIDAITAEVLSWPGTIQTQHKYGGVQFNYQGRELGHVHGNGMLDVLLSRKIKQQLLTEGRIHHHHTFTNSGWITFYIEGLDDVEYAVKLLRLSF